MMRALQEVQPGSTILQLLLGFLNSLRRAEILPEAVEMKAVKPLPAHQHARVCVSCGTEFPDPGVFLQVLENFWVKDLYAREHQLAERTGRCYRRSAVEEAADSTACVDVHGAILVGVLIRPQHQRYHRIHLNMEVDERRQIHVDERIGIDDNKSSVLQKCFRFEQSPAGVEQLPFSRIADLQAERSAAAQTTFDLLAEVMQVDDDVVNAVMAQQ